MTGTTRRLGALGACIIALTWACLALHVPGSVWVGTLVRKDAVIAMIALCGLLWAAAIPLASAASPRRTLWLILGVAAILRISLLAAPPFMSTDIYRYVWDGRVQAAGINPYLYIASDPALAALPHDYIYNSMNRVDYAHTIYPPAAQLLYALVGHISQTVTAMKIAMVLLEACGIAAMLRLLTLAGLPQTRILIYAWNPLAAWAIAGDGHIDGAAIGLLGLALLAACTRRGAVAAALLAAATLTKFLPIVAAPALWTRWQWKFPAVLTLGIAILYSFYMKAGWLVLGFLPNYTKEEGLAQGSGFYLLAALGHVTTLPRAANAIYLTLCVATLAALSLRMFLREPISTSPEAIIRRGANVALLAAGTIAALSPHYAWYYPWLALPSCLFVRPWVLWLSMAPVLLYADPWHDEILIETTVFLPAILLGALANLLHPTPSLANHWRLPPQGDPDVHHP